MKIFNTMRLIAIVAVVGIHSSLPAVSAAHTDAPLLAFEAVELGGSWPLFDTDGALLAVDRVHFRAVSADGTEFAGSGDLTLSGQDPGTVDPAMIGTLDNISGFIGNISDGTSKTFAGMAHVALHSISADAQRFAATGDMWLELQSTAPARQFDVEAELLQGSDGRWLARFRGEDGDGTRIDGLFASIDPSAAWEDTDVLHLLGSVEALEFLPAETDPNSFEDKIGSEEVYFSSYWSPGISRAELLSVTKAEAAYWRMSLGQMPPPSATDNGHFTATLLLPFNDTLSNHQHGPLNLQVDEVIVTQSQRAPDGTVSGRAEFLFSGIGSRDGVAVKVSGTAEFHYQGDSADGIDWFMAGGTFGLQSDLANAFQGDAADGIDWFMAGGSLRILNGTLEDTATGGAELFEDISGDLGQATLVGGINALGQVDLAGGLGQVTLEQ